MGEMVVMKVAVLVLVVGEMMISIGLTVRCGGGGEREVVRLP